MKNRNYWDLSIASLSPRPDCSLLLPLYVQLPWHTENFTLSRPAIKDYTSMQAQWDPRVQVVILFSLRNAIHLTVMDLTGVNNAETVS